MESSLDSPAEKSSPEVRNLFVQSQEMVKETAFFPNGYFSWKYSSGHVECSFDDTALYMSRGSFWQGLLKVGNICGQISKMMENVFMFFH